MEVNRPFQRRSSPSMNLFSAVDSRLHSPSGISLSSTASSSLSMASSQQRRIKELALPSTKTGVNHSETKRILMGLERVGSLVDSETRRPRSWFRSIPEEPEERNVLGKRRAPPTVGLPTIEKAQIVPRILLPDTRADDVHSQRVVSDGPPALKRYALDKEREDVVRETSVISYKKTDLAQKPPQFIFSKPWSALDKKKTETVTPTASTVANQSTPIPVESITSLPTFGTVQNKSTAAVMAESSSTKPSSGWWCDCCTIKNDGNVDKCVACGTKRLTPVEKSSETATKPSSWWCECCMVKNDGNVDKCIACGTRRQTSQAKTQPTPTSKPSEVGLFNKSEIVPSSKTEIVPLQAATKSKWTCGTCFVPNDESAKECLCCKTAKPVKESTNAPRGDSWWCSGCFVKNDSTSGKCTACGTDKEKRSDTEKSGTEVKKLTNWTCTTCFISNSYDKVKCVACESPKPGVAFKPVKFGMGFFAPAATTAAVVPAFAVSVTTAAPNMPKFGITFPTSLSATQIQTPIATISSTAVISTSTSSETTADVLKFPGTLTRTTMSAPVLPTVSSTTSFGLPNGNGTTTTSASTVPKFGLPFPPVFPTTTVQNQPTSKTSIVASTTAESTAEFAKTVSTTSTSSFAVKTSTDTSTTGLFSNGFGKTSTTTSSTSVVPKFGLDFPTPFSTTPASSTATTTAAPTAAPASGGFVFGASSTTAATTASASTLSGGFIFGAKPAATTATVTTTSASALGGFVFGTKPTTAASVNATTSASTLGSGFGFGAKPATTTTAATTASALGGFLFGAKPRATSAVGAAAATSTTSSAAAPAFSFGSTGLFSSTISNGMGGMTASPSVPTLPKLAAESSAPLLTASPSAPSLPKLAEPAAPTAPTSQAFTFGSGGLFPPNPTPSVFAFGSSSSNNSALSFGAATTNSSSVSFGAPSTNSSIFSFGNAASSAATAVTTTASSTSFAFGAGSNTNNALVANNPFSINQSPAASPSITGRRQLVAKRRAKRP